MNESKRPMSMDEAVAAYQNGDFARALPALRAHAAAGEGEAALYLAMMYEGGKGVAEDPTEAARWFKAAADTEITLAQFRRGMICYHGIGMEPDPEEAKERFEAAAKKGHLGSQMGIGVILEEHGDKVEAAAWLLVAATRGSESSKKLYERLLPRLTNAQTHDARSLARSLYDDDAAPFEEVTNETKGFDMTARDAHVQEDLKANMKKLRGGIACGQFEVLIDPHHLKHHLKRHGYSARAVSSEKCREMILEIAQERDGADEEQAQMMFQLYYLEGVMGLRVPGPKPSRRRFQIFRREGETISSVVAFPALASSTIEGQLRFDEVHRENGPAFLKAKRWV